jgi:beta-N-acetylhexosaminidase
MRRRTVMSGLLVAAVSASTVGVCVQAYAAAGPSRPDTPSRIDRQVRTVMAMMTLPEKIGQMFVSAVYGDSATTTAAADVAANRAAYGSDVPDGAAVVAKFHLGGVIYFPGKHNLAGPQQIAALSNGLQQASMSAENVPLQVSVDQEGGVVNRIGVPASVSPGNMAIGATFNPGSAYRAAVVSGAELRAMGVNMNDAPVVDVNTNPRNVADGSRAFGDRAAAVSVFAAGEVAGYQRSGVATQSKHFPGLGDTTVNTDDGIAVTHQSKRQIMEIDIPPFRAAIGAGTRSIMVAHIVAPALDPSGAPASLSQPIVTGLLRNTLHYDGVVGTDALDAGALATLPPNQVVLDAINAGDDELLLPPDLPAAVRAVTDAVNAGTISRPRIDQSVFRILRMKAQLDLFTNPYTTSTHVDFTVGTQQHLQTMADVAKRSITLLRNGSRTLPLTPSPATHVLVTGWGMTTTQSLTTDLSTAGLTTGRLWTGSPDQQRIDQAVAAARTADVTIVTTYNVWTDATQQNLVNALLATGKPVVVASVGAPYDIASFPSAPTYLASYDYQPVSIDALTATLVGTNPTGRLPVTIRTATSDRILFPYGSGSGYAH